MDALCSLTSALGTGLVAYTSYQLLNAARLYTRPSGLHRYLYTDASGRPAWALVTGASNGIGKSLAFELASHGFNIVLHGRNRGKLEAVRDELLQRNHYHRHTEVRILVADASQCHRVEYVDFDHIRDELATLHLTVLVNCAGAGPTPAFGTLESYAREDILDNLHLNAAFPTLLTAYLLPVLRGEYTNNNNIHDDDKDPRGVRRRGAKPPAALIINIGSVTDDGFPLVSFYSAGKAASHVLHKAIAREAALPRPSHSNSSTEEVKIEVISHRVGAVTGVSHTSAPASFFRPDAGTLARAVLARTGCGHKEVTPYWPHALQGYLLAALPAVLLDRAIGAAMVAERDEEVVKRREGRTQ